MPSRRSLLRYALCAPWDLVVLVLAPLLWLTRQARPRLRRGVVWLDVREGAWLERSWRYSTTLGHVVLLQPGLCGSQVEDHELVHVQQYEGAVCSVWLVAVTFALGTLATGWAGLVMVGLLAPWWGYAGASLAALLRDERPYLDNCFERHARAEVLTCGHLEG